MSLFLPLLVPFWKPGAEVVGLFDRLSRWVEYYDNLRHPRPGCPRILIVLLLPADERQWSTQTEDELVLRHCAYWISLKGRAATDIRRLVRVQIPRANVFSIAALQEMMKRIKQGEE